MKTTILVLSLLIISITNLNAQQDTLSPFLLNEATFGVGIAHSFEKDLFNVPQDVKGGTNLGINISYFRYLTKNWAIGIDMYGYFKTVDDVLVQKPEGTILKVKLNVSTFNLAGEGRYIFMRGSVEPYCFALLAYSAGSLENKELGTLNLSGVSAGGGAGIAVPLGEEFIFSFETLASFGSANWKQAPFTNSSGKEFNPSMIALLGQISYRFER